MVESAAKSSVVRFGSFRLDIAAERLWDGSDPITLRPKTWQVLRYLVENAERVVGKRELLDAIWGDVVVEEKAINTCIGEIRTALGESSREPRFIETVQRRGFRFRVQTGASPATTAVRHAPDEVSAGAFVGRCEELQALQTRLARLPAAHAMSVVAGPAGIGKSRLVSEAVQRAGAFALVGQCIEGGGLPYLPWVEMIRAHLRDRPDFDWRGTLGNAIGEFERLIPALHISSDPAPASSSDPELARLRLFEAIAAFFEAACRTEPVILIVEDLHWIDAASLRALQALLPRLAGSRAHVIATLREEDAAAGSPVRVTLNNLLRRRLVEVAQLRGLAPEETHELIGRLGGASMPTEMVEKIVLSTEGSPFFVEEIVRHYGGKQVATEERSPAPELFLPANVVELFERRCRRLSSPAQRLIEALAIAGTECDEPLLEHVLQPSNDVLAAIHEAIEHRIVRENPARPGRYGFGHALMALAVLQGLTPPLRRRWHRQLAEALLATRGDAGERIAEIARHLARAVPAVPVDRAVAALLEAADQADSHLAYEDAFEHAARALELALGPQSNSELRLRLPELALRCAEALQKIGDADKAARAFREAAELARAARQAACFARATLGMATIWEFEAPDLREYLEEALCFLGAAEPALRARLLARLSVVLYPISGTRSRCEELSSEAVALARRIGDSSLLGQTLVDWLAGQWYQDNIGAQEAVSEELLEVARRSADGALVATAHGWRSVIALCSGDVARAGRETHALRELAPQLGQPLYQWCALYLSATLALLHGELESAESLATQAFEHGSRASPQSATIVYFTQMVTLRREQGRIGEIIPLVEQNPARMSSDALVWNLPHFFLEADRLEEGRAAFARACALGFAKMPGENSRNRRLMTVGAMGLACAALDDKAVAAELYPLILPDAQRWAVAGFGAVSYGLLESAAGALATCLGHYETATRHFELAIAEYERQQVRIALARAYYFYADMLLRRRHSGDTKQAELLLARATALADECGLVRVRTLIERLRSAHAPGSAKPKRHRNA